MACVCYLRASHLRCKAYGAPGILHEHLVFIEEFYKYRFRTAMGAPVSIARANIALEALENAAITSYKTAQNFLSDT